MYTSEYWSKRVSWVSQPSRPRLSIHSVLRFNTPANHLHDVDVAGGKNAPSEVTGISYSHSRTPRRHPKLRAYIHQISRPFLRRFKSGVKVTPAAPQSKKGNTNGAEMSDTRSSLHLPQSFSLPTSPISGSTMLSQIEQDRAIRAEQDAAFDRAQMADRGRLEKLREQRIREEELARKIAEQQEHERLRREKEAAYKRAQNDWRRWARRALTPTVQNGKGIELAVRLPSGRRRAVTLPSTSSMQVLYTVVETLLIPEEFTPDNDPEEPPEGFEHFWEFRLVKTNNRLVFSNDPDIQIGSSEVLRSGVLLIVEEIAGEQQTDDEMD